MAAHERLESTASIVSQELVEKLAVSLPKGAQFKIYHLSTPPTRTSSLCSAPPDSRPDRTYCENHFLAASINTPPKHNAEIKEVLIFAIEVLIYSTAHSTIFFVSKADSTGYLHMLEIPKGSSSPLREISSTFLRYLVEQRRRPNIRSVISLFARAQDQYLFPGSIEYSGKHVLDDRSLVRWWCRVLNPLVEDSRSPAEPQDSQLESAKGYLIVPGLDRHETLSYIPKQVAAQKSHWEVGHPLRQISRFSEDVPPRCLIPHYPDDPKARFLDELDEEIKSGQNCLSGQWKSVKTIDQFWDMMAFRQECSAGRLVGFIWVVYCPRILGPEETDTGKDQPTAQTVDSEIREEGFSLPSTSLCPDLHLLPNKSTNASSQSQTPPPLVDTSDEKKTGPQETTQPHAARAFNKKVKLSGPIVPRQPRIKTQQRSHLVGSRKSTAYYDWQAQGRGQIVIEEPDYKRVTELLLRLDFANLELASSSSARWINEVRSGTCGITTGAWGQAVTGNKQAESFSTSRAEGINTLKGGLVRKKRKAGPE